MNCDPNIAVSSKLNFYFRKKLSKRERKRTKESGEKSKKERKINSKTVNRSNRKRQRDAKEARTEGQKEEKKTASRT